MIDALKIVVRMLLESITTAYATQDENGNVLAYLSKDEDAEAFEITTRTRASDFINAAHKNGTKYIEWDPTEEHPDVEPGTYTINDWINELGYHDKVSFQRSDRNEDATPVFVLYVHEGSRIDAPYIIWMHDPSLERLEFDGNIDDLVRKIKASGYHIELIEYSEDEAAMWLMYDPTHWQASSKRPANYDSNFMIWTQLVGKPRTKFFEPLTKAARDILAPDERVSTPEAHEIAIEWFKVHKDWGSKFINELYD